MRKSIIIVLAFVALFSGCGHFRYVATSETQPAGGVQTKNRYRLFQFGVRGKGGYVKLNDLEFAQAWATFKSTMPHVFSDDGKPVAIYLDGTDKREKKYGWTFLFPYLLTIGIFPMWDHNEWTSHYSVRFKNPKKVKGASHNAYAVKIERDWNMSCYGPIALCIPYETPVAGVRGQPFSRKQVHVLGSTDQVANGVVLHSAIAYGAACTLKRMEEEGTLPDNWEDSTADGGAGAQIATPIQEKQNEADVVEIDSIPFEESAR